MDLGGKCVSFEEGFDFVIEEATEDLQDGHGLVSDLEILLSFFCHFSLLTPLDSFGASEEAGERLLHC